MNGNRTSQSGSRRRKPGGGATSSRYQDGTNGRRMRPVPQRRPSLNPTVFPDSPVETPSFVTVNYTAGPFIFGTTLAPFLTSSKITQSVHYYDRPIFTPPQLSFVNSANNGTLLEHTTESDFHHDVGVIHHTSVWHEYLFPFLCLFPIITIVGNTLVVFLCSLILTRQTLGGKVDSTGSFLNMKTRQRARAHIGSVYGRTTASMATNCYLISLASADLVIGAFVMPLALYLEVTDGVWGLGPLFCDLWITVDNLATAASILSLAGIAQNRYLAITKPIFYTKMQKLRPLVFLGIPIGIIWLISIIVAAPIVLGLNDVPFRKPQYCKLYRVEYLLYTSVISFFIPSIIIGLQYVAVFRAIGQRSQRMMKRRVSVMFTRIKRNSLSYNGSGASEVDRQTVQKASSAVFSKSLASDVPSQVTSPTESGLNFEIGPTDENRPKLSTIEETKYRMPRTISPLRQRRSTSLTNLDDQREIRNLKNRLRLNFEELPNEFPIYRTSSTSSQSYSDNFDRIYCSKSTKSLNEVLRRHSHAENWLVSIEPADYSFNNSPMTPTMAEVVKSVRISDQSGKIIDQLDEKSAAALIYSTNSHFFKNIERHVSNRRQSRVRKTGKRHVLRGKSIRDRLTKDRKATIMLSIVVILFYVCWLPYFIATVSKSVCAHFDDDRHDVEPCIPDVVMHVLAWLGHANSMANPFVYAVFNAEFRAAFRRVFIYRNLH